MVVRVHVCTVGGARLECMRTPQHVWSRSTFCCPLQVLPSSPLAVFSFWAFRLLSRSLQHLLRTAMRAPGRHKQIVQRTFCRGVRTCLTMGHVLQYLVGAWLLCWQDRAGCAAHRTTPPEWPQLVALCWVAHIHKAALMLWDSHSNNAHVCMALWHLHSLRPSRSSKEVHMPHALSLSHTHTPLCSMVPCVYNCMAWFIPMHRPFAGAPSRAAMPC